MGHNIDNLKQLLRVEYTYLRHCERTPERTLARKQPKVTREEKKSKNASRPSLLPFLPLPPLVKKSMLLSNYNQHRFAGVS